MHRSGSRMPPPARPPARPPPPAPGSQRKLLWVALALALAGLALYIRHTRLSPAWNLRVLTALDAPGWILEGAEAPGISALRAAGCSSATVVEASVAAEALDWRAPSEPASLVLCLGSRGDADCQDLAAAWLEEVGAHHQAFVVMRLERLQGQPRCEASFNTDGSPM